MKRSERLRRRAFTEALWTVFYGMMAVVMAIGAWLAMLWVGDEECLVILLPVMVVGFLFCVVVALDRAWESVRLTRLSWEESLYELRRSVRWNTEGLNTWRL